MPEKEIRSMMEVSSVIAKSSESRVKDVTSSVMRWSVIDLGIDLDSVVRPIGVVLARELGRHPLPPVEREALQLELEQHGHRCRHGQAGCKVGRLLEEQRLVLDLQRVVEVATDEGKGDRDASVGNDK